MTLNEFLKKYGNIKIKGGYDDEHGNVSCVQARKNSPHSAYIISPSRGAKIDDSAKTIKFACTAEVFGAVFPWNEFVDILKTKVSTCGKYKLLTPLGMEITGAEQNDWGNMVLFAD